MNCYEHTFITKQDLSDSQTKKLVDKYEGIISANSGKVLKIEEWGLRNLSHRIQNNRKARNLLIPVHSGGFSGRMEYVSGLPGVPPPPPC